MTDSEGAAALRHEPPADVGAAGLEVWRAIVVDLPANAELDARELLILTNAARQADQVAELEAAVAEHGVMIAGANGQTRMNSAVAELRQARLAVNRMLGELGLEDDVAGIPESAATRRARRAANTRWHRDPAPHRDQQELSRA